jgi:hypothetical protein
MWVLVTSLSALRVSLGVDIVNYLHWQLSFVMIFFLYYHVSLAISKIISYQTSKIHAVCQNTESKRQQTWIFLLTTN